MIQLRIKLKAELSSKFHSCLREIYVLSVKKLLWPSRSLTPQSVSNRPSIFEAKCLSNTQLDNQVHKMCTGGLVCGIENLFLNSPLPLCLWRLEKGVPSINCIALSGPPIRRTGRTLVAEPIVICCVQCCSLSQHYYNGCAAGGHLRISIEELCSGYDGMTKLEL